MPGRGWRAAAPLVLAASGLLMVVSARAAGGEDLRAGETTDLVDLVREQERRVAVLDERASGLSAEVQALTAAAEPASGSLERRLAELREIAGLEPVRGPAVVVALDDAPLPGEGQPLPEGATYDDFVVHQQDLEGVINALWAGGAEAMAIMGERVVSTSAVRCVGNVLILHGRVYSPPFTITAIGDVDAMSRSLDRSPAVGAYRSWADYIGLGYRVSTARELTVPGYQGPVELAEAS